MMVNRQTLQKIAVASLSLGLLTSGSDAQSCDLPISGCEVDYLGDVDALMTDFMCDREIPGAALAISMDGVVVYERAFGWSDEQRSISLDPDALMRIASVSKPITAAAIRELIDDGVLSINSRAFDLGQPGGGVLPIDPFPSLGDARLGEVTIDHLLQHRGGWDRDAVGDLTYREVLIANAMGIPSPPGRSNTLRYILGQPLQADPGAEYHYSNIGYLTLGLIVEHLSGQPLIEFVHDRVLGPLGVEESEHLAGRTFAADQNPREPRYHSPAGATNVYEPNGAYVPWAYGGWDHEARVGQGGQITTTRTLLAFLNERYISGPSIGAPLPPDLNPCTGGTTPGRSRARSPSPASGVTGSATRSSSINAQAHLQTTRARSALHWTHCLTPMESTGPIRPLRHASPRSISTVTGHLTSLTSRC